MRPRWIHAIEGILYALTLLLLLLRELVPGTSHGPAVFHDPLLVSGERPADTALHDAEAQHRRAADWVLLLVTHGFEGDSPQPRDGDEGEIAMAEVGLRLHVWCCVGAALRRRRSNRTCVLVGCKIHER